MLGFWHMRNMTQNVNFGNAEEEEFKVVAAAAVAAVAVAAVALAVATTRVAMSNHPRSSKLGLFGEPSSLLPSPPPL